MTLRLLTEHHVVFLQEAAQARLSLHLSKYHIVGNPVSWLNYVLLISICVSGVISLSIWIHCATSKLIRIYRLQKTAKNLEKRLCAAQCTYYVI